MPHLAQPLPSSPKSSFPPFGENLNWSKKKSFMSRISLLLTSLSGLCKSLLSGFSWLLSVKKECCAKNDERTFQEKWTQTRKRLCPPPSFFIVSVCLNSTCLLLTRTSLIFFDDLDLLIKKIFWECRIVVKSFWRMIKQKSFQTTMASDSGIGFRRIRDAFDSFSTIFFGTKVWSKRRWRGDKEMINFFAIIKDLKDRKRKKEAKEKKFHDFSYRRVVTLARESLQKLPSQLWSKMKGCWWLRFLLAKSSYMMRLQKQRVVIFIGLHWSFSRSRS